MKRATFSIRRRAMSLIELLVVLSIIALLAAILMPSLSAAREQAKIAKCLSNLRSHMQYSHMYMENDSQKVIEWFKYPAIPGFGVTLFTNAVFGGFQAPIGLDDGYVSDAEAYPAQVRPLNLLVSPMAVGRTILDLYKCPSDKSYTPGGGVGATIPNVDNLEGLRSWEAVGTSYVLNSGFMQGYAWAATSSCSFSMAEVEEYSHRIAAHLVGGKASRFAMWLEQRFYALSNNAVPTLGDSLAPPRGYGWHLQFSRYSAGFYDGHAEYRYFDTRLSSGDGWTLWEP